MKSKTRLIPTLRWLIGIGIVVALGLYGIKKTELLDQLLKIPLSILVIGVGLTILSRLVLSEVSYTILKVLRHPIQRWEIFHLTWMRGYINLVIPSGGTATLAAYFKRRAGMPWSQFAVFLVPQTIIQIFALGLIGLVAAVINMHTLGPTQFAMLVFIFGGLSIAAFIMLYAKLPGWLVKKSTINHLRTHWQKIVSNHKMIILLVFYNATLVLLRAIRLGIIFSGLGYDVGMSQILLMSLLSDIAFILNITPAGIGIRESILVLSGALLGESVQALLAVALIDRAIMIFTIVVMAQISTLYLAKKIKEETD